VEEQLKTMFSEFGRGAAKAGSALDKHRRSIAVACLLESLENAP
jgi:hypothetical protein